jgi:hypothetical protein
MMTKYGLGYIFGRFERNGAIFFAEKRSRRQSYDKMYYRRKTLKQMAKMTQKMLFKGTNRS